MNLHRAFLGAVAVGAVGVSACAPVVPPTMRAVGDSITVMSAPDIHARYDATYSVTIGAAIGLDTYLAAPMVAAAAAAKPKVAFIDLGTNDAQRMGQDFGPGDPAQTPESVNARLDTFAAEFPATTCVVFVTVNTHNPSWGPVAAQAINDHVRTFAHVADWDAAWNPADYATADNPHPTAAGRQHLLDVEAAAMASCP